MNECDFTSETTDDFRATRLVSPDAGRSSRGEVLGGERHEDDEDGEDDGHEAHAAAARLLRHQPRPTPPANSSM